MTPLALEMLIWLHTRGDIEDFPNYTRPPQQEAVAKFIRDGVCNSHATELTPLGRAWLMSMLSTPMPEVRFVDPRTNEVLAGH